MEGNTMECDVCKRKVQVVPITITFAERGPQEFTSIQSAQLCPACKEEARRDTMNVVPKLRRRLPGKPI
jgi:hypothetical protein